MSVIELECPSCGSLLELDAGFAGGVCRCSHCGTLMTVPADGNGSGLRAAVRPERPESPLSRSDRPVVRAPVAETAEERSPGGAEVAGGSESVEGSTAGSQPAPQPMGEARKRRGEGGEDATASSTGESTPPDEPDLSRDVPLHESAIETGEEDPEVEAPSPPAARRIRRRQRKEKASSGRAKRDGEPEAEGDTVKRKGVEGVKPQSRRQGDVIAEATSPSGKGKSAKAAGAGPGEVGSEKKRKAEQRRAAKQKPAFERRRGGGRQRWRALVHGLFVTVLTVVLLAMLGAAGWVVWYVNQQPSGTLGLGANARGEADPSKNPFLLSEANMFQTALAGRSVVVMETGGLEEGMLPVVHAMAQAAAARADTQRLQFVFCDARGSVAVPRDGPTMLEASHRDELASVAGFLPDQEPSDLVEQVKQAVRAEPGQVVLVCSGPLPAEPREKIRRMITRTIGARLDVVMLGEHDEEMQRVARNLGGTYVRVRREQALQWWEASREGGGGASGDGRADQNAVGPVVP